MCPTVKKRVSELLALVFCIVHGSMSALALKSREILLALQKYGVFRTEYLITAYMHHLMHWQRVDEGCCQIEVNILVGAVV